jgi:predicted phage tail protein
VVAGTTYQYRVLSTNVGGSSVPSNVVTIAVAVPDVPASLTATAARQGSGERVTFRWGDVTNETSYNVQWSTTRAFTVVAGTSTTAANVTTFVTGTIARQVWFFRVRAVNALGASAYPAPIQVAAAP